MKHFDIFNSLVVYESRKVAWGPKDPPPHTRVLMVLTAPYVSYVETISGHLFGNALISVSYPPNSS